jgi:hypothetical protein
LTTTEAHIFPNLPKYPLLYICQPPSTNQPLFMQNKPNYLDSRMNISSVMTNHYEQKPHLRPPPKQTQSNPIKPNFKTSRRLMSSINRPLEKPLKLYINHDKSAAAGILNRNENNSCFSFKKKQGWVAEGEERAKLPSPVVSLYKILPV